MRQYMHFRDALLVALTALTLISTLPTIAQATDHVDVYPANESTPTMSQGMQATADHLSKGAALERDREYAEALMHYKQALAYAPGDGQIYNRMAGVYNAMGDESASLVNYTLAIASNPNFFDARLSRAQICLRLGYNTQALRDLNVALKINPRSADAFYQRGTLLLKLQRIREAFRDFLRAHQLSPRYPRPTLNGDVPIRTIGA